MAYNRVNWQNGASGGTPINASNLNTMDKGIKDIDDTLTTSDGKSFEFESENGKYGYKVDGAFHPFKTVDGAKSQSITVNGTYTLEPSTGYDGIESATVEVNVSGGGSTIQPSKTTTASTSTKTVYPDSGFDGMATVIVNPTPSESKTLTITENGSYPITPSSGKLLSGVSVDVNVSGGGVETEELWTNASPTSNFTGQTVTLSKSIAEFSHLEIEIKRARTDTDLSFVNKVIYDTSYLMATSGGCKLTVAIYSRQFRSLSANRNQITFDSADASVGSAYCIPLTIKGIKMVMP